MSALMNMIKVETKLFLRDPTTLTFGVLFPTTLLLGLGSIPALRESSPDTAGCGPSTSGRRPHWSSGWS